MNSMLKGQHIISPGGPGEVVETIGNKIVIQLDNGGLAIFNHTDISSDAVEVTVIAEELPEVAEERAEHAAEIVDRLNHSSEQNNTYKINQQPPMEISGNTIDVINDLIKINNDRVAGFEKAGADLENDDNNLIPIFNKLAGESRLYAQQLTGIAIQNGADAAEGTSTSGDLHRAWIDIKSTFTGNDSLAILNECERGEDAAKAAYRDALDPENRLNPELVQVLVMQQQGITEGHDLIKSLRDQLKASDGQADNIQEEKEEFTSQTSYAPLAGEFQAQSVYTPEAQSVKEDENLWDEEQEKEEFVQQPSYEGSAGEFTPQATFLPEPESVEQEEAWQDEQETGTGESKLMEFFINELKDLLWAERELVDVLPDMAEAATSQELKTAFNTHLAETGTHVTRLEQIFGILGLEPESRKCEAMAGIVDEGDEIISATEEGTAQRDVGLIFAGQKAEHYEIASYGGMIALAKTLGYYDIAEMLVLTLDEEKTADAKLTEIAEGQANYEASTERAED